MPKLLAFAIYNGRTVDVLRRAPLWDLMDRYPEAAERFENSNKKNWADEYELEYAAILTDDDWHGIPRLVPATELTPTPGAPQ